MAFNGSGVYSAPSNTWNPPVADTEIDVDDFIELLADIATALTKAICKDGQSTCSAAIPFAAGLTTGAGTTSLTPIIIPHGAAHSAPTNGGIWTTTTGLFVRINGATYQMASIAGTESLSAKTLTDALISVVTPVSTSAGYLGAPVNTQTDSYTLVAADAGKTIRMNKATATTLTIPPNSSVAFPAGTTIVVRNIGAGTCTITRGASVALRLAGVSTDANRALAQYGQCVLSKDDTDSWYVTGTVT